MPVWSEAFGPGDHRAALRRAAHHPEQPLSLYVHIPFCREMCTYCGCNVVVTRDRAKHSRYLDVLERELALLGRQLGDRRTLSRLHLGGGTPTSLDEASLERLYGMITAELALAPDAEMAVEIDPAVTSRGQLALLRRLGWNRVSFGVQDFDEAVQAAVNRIQPFDMTQRTIQDARELGYRSVNVDLIYGLPHQRPETWIATLDQVLALGVDRIAIFSFAYVPLLKPHQRRLPLADMPSPELKLELFRLAHDRLVDAGFVAIGMDHFARPHDELARAQTERRLWRDFQGYTTQRASDTVAVGMSSISSVGGAFVQSHKRLRHWEEAITRGELPVERGHWLSPDDERRRDVITQIMCNFWIDLGEGWTREREALAPLVEDGLVVLEGNQLTVTPLGRLFVRNVAMAFDAYLGQTRGTFSRTV